MIRLRLNIYQLCSVVLIFSLGNNVWGENVADLYVAEATVAGQGSKARSAAIRKAFAQVLVKVSGDRSLPGKASIAKEMGKANSYVQQYRYRSLEASQIGQSNTADAPDRLLWVRFDESTVNRLLRSSGIPVWGDARPSTLLWLGVESRGRRSLYQPELSPALRNGLDQVARSRGLPILFPLMDLEDRSNLQVSDVWGTFEEAIRTASDRYLPDVILVGRLRKRGGNDWIADWTLYQPDTVKNWQTLGKTRRSVAAEGLQQVVDNLVSRFAPQGVAQGDSSLRIRVAGLNHLADYVLVKDYLHSMAMIEQLDLLAASPNEVSFLVRVQGGRDALERGIMLGRVLEPIVAQGGMVNPGAVSPQELDAQSLDYRLRP